ncbi:Hsp20/alpha crystallin family protein [Candidatus Ventrimonas sp. KK005]
MLLPSIFTENLLDDFFDHPHHSNHFRSYASEMLRTDIKDLGNVYEMTMNLPGVKKENVKAELKDGYLTISAVSAARNDEKNSDGVYIRRERYAGSSSRSFYVGEDVKQEDIKAKFEDGTLKLQVPKKNPAAVVENTNYIQIEG